MAPFRELAGDKSRFCVAVFVKDFSGGLGVRDRLRPVAQPVEREACAPERPRLGAPVPEIARDAKLFREAFDGNAGFAEARTGLAELPEHGRFCGPVTDLACEREELLVAVQSPARVTGARKCIPEQAQRAPFTDPVAELPAYLEMVFVAFNGPPGVPLRGIATP